MNTYVHIGKIVASQGLTGEVVIKHALGKKSTFKNIEALFIEEQKDSYIPWFIESSSAKNETETTVKLEGVNTKESTVKLVRKNVWLTNEDFRSLAGQASPLALLHYTIYNNDKKIGIVEEVIEQPHQVLLRINYKENEALIPLHAETLKGISHDTHEVFVSLPDGLLEIYEQ